ncbi:MAG: winged helix-turn-helix transcriptional regulator [candidate division Zixibacteria bacterium]|nr:winged helix-turn-helix transcriptional regulator [candidate division Zixibacteria bacterium]
MKIVNTEIFQIHSEVCKTLANPTRLMILALLAKKEMSVGEIVDVIGVHLANISQHLGTLRSKNIVKARREGHLVFYSLVDRRLIEACNLIRLAILEDMKKRGKLAEDFDASNIVIDE